MEYTTLKTQVIDDYCLRCHNAEKRDGKVSLATYQEVASFKSEIAKSIANDSMPKRGQLLSWQKELFLAWLNEGAPERSNKRFVPSDEAEAKRPAQAHEGGVLPSIVTFEQEVLARGRYLFNLSSCANCHTVDPKKPLAGGKALTTPFGVFYTPNISASKTHGIGGWTGREFIKAMREGISPKGEFYYPSFPFTNYSKMTDQDLLAIRAYIISLPATDQPNRAHEISGLYSFRSLLGIWRTENFPVAYRPTPKNFMTAKGPYVELVEQSLAWNRGAYLVEGPLHCTQCHTPRGPLGGLIVRKWFAGSTVAGGSKPAPNITPDPDTGLKNWTKEVWLTFLNTGVTPSGDKVGEEMWPVIKEATSQLTLSDKTAVIEYLQSIGPVNHRVQ